MALTLSKKLIFFVLLVLTGRSLFSQNGAEPPVYKDYKDPERFERFRKRSIIVGAWQINTLKEEGAIVVRLKTNKLLIDGLLKSGNKELAIEKQLEQYAINRNVVMAYKTSLDFCKVYFMYSNSSDTLLKGARQGFFLDSNLVVDPSIVMAEKYYIIAEKDFAYTSTIGFVREDSAQFVKEEGNPIKQMSIVLKNKYGHQLKSPMPYAIKNVSFGNVNYFFPIKYKEVSDAASSITFPVNRTYFLDLKNKTEQKVALPKEEGFIITNVRLKKEMSFETMSNSVNQLNDELHQVYRDYSKPDINRVKIEIKPFLY